MKTRPWHRRILCALGFHSWRWFTCEEGAETRGCACCPVAQYRLIDCTGHPLGRWEAWDPREPVLGPEW